MKLQTKQSGFTLVEIAIVLVIIGLLLGGILQGQQLITNAKVRNIIDQQSGVQAAFYGFQDRFKAIPGDLTAAQATIVGGTPAAQTATTLPADGAVTAADSATAFDNLRAAGFISCGVCTATGVSNAANSPTNTYGAPLRLANTNDYQLGAGAGPLRMHVTTGNLAPAEVLREVDAKMDDGTSNAGRFVESAWNGGAAACAVGNPGVWAAPGTQANCGGATLF